MQNLIFLLNKDQRFLGEVIINNQDETFVERTKLNIVYSDSSLINIALSMDKVISLRPLDYAFKECGYFKLFTRNFEKFIFL